MFPKDALTRRMVLQRIGLGSICLAALAKPGYAAATARFDGRPELRLAVDLIHIALPHYRNAARLGAAYLGTAPEEYDAHRLLAAVVTRSSDMEIAIRSGDPDTVRSNLRRQITRDFEGGDIAEVDGWVLSLTEVRLAALAHMVHDFAPNIELG